MLKSSLCDFNDSYILFKGYIEVNITTVDDAAANNTNKKLIFKDCSPFTDCTRQINNTKVDNAKDINIVMPMYNLIEYCDNYSKTYRRLWQYCKDIPTVNDHGTNTTDSFNFKAKITIRLEIMEE